ncbi:MAG: bifunctional (p)ppGpp synthetase/guanosine-3',5'-bis(diphosphate) 3'-pyrophosphohydrolase [Saccharofermentans sp.]|jgi:GTP pyrophosphokinase|nr:bifunctional (p)ppGpp synthetase/guanosine-3',5'-bis(diphosphate) 3'-pyrophosphohydrolase [Mageeibacillus sp.]MCI1264751.1 bifunctional (p)ppGpp synthetase/guanosine-3',5'-bis(diphosphate) 3'-pyrophosphohydrolase [Saccharofermentans sp.]MCI1274578.1 bifunctional (p)ppGpp synthetase/guanosine-3',5'-bis(diphosphate) 3'-pyrophosphohydrolase [Saccharofermentans sp.]MCI2043864.1 bifunctional (p)ppGpp synthetase/guanosine-3',5'-bis(diphosphate) 3'-pyrophosphohydrolase [Mageeibacillus sp.]
MGKIEEKSVFSEEEIKKREYYLDTAQIPEIDEIHLAQFEEILNEFESYSTLSSDDLQQSLDMLRKAFYLAYKAHAGQKRKTGEPYIIHPLAVTRILVDLKSDADTLAAALLHDTIEDTLVDYEMLETMFGTAIAKLVDGVTKLNISLDGAVYGTKDDIQASNVRKMLIAMIDDYRVIVVKLADRLHNMRTLGYQTKEKQIEKAQETLDIYVPFAGRFGIYKIKWELEDLCLKYLHPEDYDYLKDIVNGNHKQREDFMEQVVSEIRAKLEENGITHFEIEGRPKHFYSIYKKMHDKGKTIDEIYDLYACRIIVDTLGQCYMALGIIHEMYNPIPGRFKDYIAMPKENKYQSIHTTVLSHNGPSFEVQIRTYVMNQVAEYGIAAHWHYKESGASVGFNADKYDKKMNEMRQIAEAQNELSDSKSFLDAVKQSIEPEEVFVYTPKHELIILPRGSCPIDFAYSIHSNLGHHMHGAKVNGRIVPLTYVLQTGDMVQIMSSEKLVKGPSRDWIKIAFTPNARSKINAWFKREAKSDNIAAGKRDLSREIERNGFEVSRLITEKSVNNILRRNNFQTLDDMYAGIGYGSVSVVKVFGRLRDDYIRNCTEEERQALGYRITSDGNVAYSPKDVPIQIGKFDQSHSKMKTGTGKVSADADKGAVVLGPSAIGVLSADPHQAVNALRPAAEPMSAAAAGRKDGAKRPGKSRVGEEIEVDGLDSIAMHIANCCHPVYGDDIIGYVTQENGIGIHKVTCSNIVSIISNKDKSLRYHQRYARLKPAHWGDKLRMTNYDVKVVIESENRVNLISDICDKVNEEKIIIGGIKSYRCNSVFRIELTITVADKGQLDRIMAKLPTVPSVISVYRS